MSWKYFVTKKTNVLVAIDDRTMIFMDGQWKGQRFDHPAFESVLLDLDPINANEVDERFGAPLLIDEHPGKMTWSYGILNESDRLVALSSEGNLWEFVDGRWIHPIMGIMAVDYLKGDALTPEDVVRRYHAPLFSEDIAEYNEKHKGKDGQY